MDERLEGDHVRPQTLELLLGCIDDSVRQIGLRPLQLVPLGEDRREVVIGAGDGPGKSGFPSACKRLHHEAFSIGITADQPGHSQCPVRHNANAEISVGLGQLHAPGRPCDGLAGIAIESMDVSVDDACLRELAARRECLENLDRGAARLLRLGKPAIGGEAADEEAERPSFLQAVPLRAPDPDQLVVRADRLVPMVGGRAFPRVLRPQLGPFRRQVARVAPIS
jgi:hypothetical protein